MSIDFKELYKDYLLNKKKPSYFYGSYLCFSCKFSCLHSLVCYAAHIQSTFEKLEQELREINSNRETLRHNFTELMEMKYLLHMAEDFFEQVRTADLTWVSSC